MNVIHPRPALALALLAGLAVPLIAGCVPLERQADDLYLRHTAVVDRFADGREDGSIDDAEWRALRPIRRASEGAVEAAEAAPDEAVLQVARERVGEFETAIGEARRP